MDSADRLGHEQGSVTAETAVALPAVVLVLAALLWGLVVGASQLRCVEASRAGARAAARGDGDAGVVAAARTAAGRLDPSVVVHRKGGMVQVQVQAVVRPPWRGLRRLMPALSLSSRATAAVEPGG